MFTEHDCLLLLLQDSNFDCKDCTLSSLPFNTFQCYDSRFSAKTQLSSPFKVSFQCSLTSKSGQWISKIWFCFLLSSWTGFVLMLPMPSLFCTSSAMHFTWNQSKHSKEPQVFKTICCVIAFPCLNFCFHKLNHRHHKMAFSESTIKVNWLANTVHTFIYYLNCSLKNKGTFALPQQVLFSCREFRSCSQFCIVHVAIFQVIITVLFYFLRTGIALIHVSFIAVRKRTFY